MLSTRHFGGAPVVAGDEVIGVISLTDIVGFLINAPQDDADGADDTHDRNLDATDDDADAEADTHLTALSEDLWDEWPEASSARGSSVLDRCTVEEAMNREVIRTSPQATVRDAARLMQKRGIHRLLVLHGNRLKGILSALDIARAVSKKGFAGEGGVSGRLCPPQEGVWR
jgi:CBS domain-containing protein